MTLEEKQAMSPRTACGYCMGGELLDAFGIKICDLSVSTLILFREQSHPGRCIVAYKDHVSEITDISDEERNAFFADVRCHLHMHLVPKYKDGYEWGGVFAMNPGQTFLSDAAYADMIAKIRANL